MEYVLRLVANNVVGPSPPSEPTKRFLAAVSIEDHNANAFVLEDLEEFTIYQIIVQAYNDVGSSQHSPSQLPSAPENLVISELSYRFASICL